MRGSRVNQYVPFAKLSFDENRPWDWGGGLSVGVWQQGQERVGEPHFSLAVAHESVAVQKNRRTKIHPWCSLSREIRPKPSDGLHLPFLVDNPPRNITTQRLLKPASRQYRQDGTILDANLFPRMIILTFWPPGEHSQDQEDVSNARPDNPPRPLRENETRRTTERPYILDAFGNLGDV